MPFLRTLTLWDYKETKTRRTTALQEDGTKRVPASFAAAKELRGGEPPGERRDWGLHLVKNKLSVKSGCLLSGVSVYVESM